LIGYFFAILCLLPKANNHTKNSYLPLKAPTEHFHYSISDLEPAEAEIQFGNQFSKSKLENIMNRQNAS
jgi:hypothetical protein